VGGAHTSFELEGNATGVQALIRDSQGQVVRTLDMGRQLPGTHTVNWDGNDDAGNRLSAGRYRLEVDARGQNGEPVATNTQIRGRVSAISYERGFPELIVGDAKVMLGDVISIGQ
jgi:flagellar basal-body rod modification protein FlgD